MFVKVQKQCCRSSVATRAVCLSADGPLSQLLMCLQSCGMCDWEWRAVTDADHRSGLFGDTCLSTSAAHSPCHFYHTICMFNRAHSPTHVAAVLQSAPLHGALMYGCKVYRPASISCIQFGATRAVYFS